MRIKRFEAHDTKTALAMVKQEMGDSAVILATRTLSPSERRVHGLQRSLVEVVAAMDYDAEAILADAMPAREAAREMEPPRLMKTHYDPAASLRHEDTVSISRKTAFQEATRGPLQTASGAHSAQKTRTHFAGLLPEEKSAPAKPANRTSKPDARLVAKWRDELIRQVAVKPLSLTPGRGPKIIALVGATGVGKTTTAAKIAAWFSIREKRSVALLSMDTYRIGATDQLRTYARIMRIPCEIAIRKNDLGKAIEKHAQRDLIIIDTMGKSPYDKEHIADLAEWFGVSDRIEPHLVLNATAKKEDLRHVIGQYATLPAQGCILTKLDETRAYANLCQQIAELGIPVSCLCTGQQVPEDFLLASPLLLRILFGQGWSSFLDELSLPEYQPRHSA